VSVSPPLPPISAHLKLKQVGAVVRPLDQGSTNFPTRGQLVKKNYVLLQEFPPNTGLQNRWSYTSTTPICLRVLDRNNYL
jgi:hypothetical protein